MSLTAHTLPIDELKEQALAELGRLKAGERLVISAPTGSGKSTRIPVWARQAGHGRVLVIEPRRLACRTLAGWVASGLGEQPGQTVGYGIRREMVGSESSQILFVTPGVARRLLSQEQLFDFATVIFDEFHERSWETDTVMAVLAALREGAPRLILMSATLQAQRLVEAYGARSLESAGRSFPVAVRYQTEPTLSAPSSQNLIERVARAIEQAWTGRGKMLVFLPGLAAMQQVQARLSRLPVQLLHGSFSRARQDQAFAEDEPAIILATNVAESSLTVPGVVSVIDSGLEKRVIHQSGYVALATVPISQASAEQRAGRAGRTAPGVCWRLWDPKARLEPSRPPDLARMELDDLLLYLAALPQGLKTACDWLDAPPGFAWERAEKRLRAKALIDDHGKLSQLGKRAEKLPVEADWARLLALSPEPLRADLCDLYAFSSARRSWISTSSQTEEAERRRLDFGEEPWSRALAMLRRGESKIHGLDAETLEEARAVAQELRELLGAGPQPSELRPHPELKEFLARHWPERHFVRRATRDAWANGEIECRAGRSEQLAEECLAAIFLRVEPVLGRGLKVDLRGTAALPVELSLLRRCGYGSPELSKIRFREQKVTARVAQVFAGRVLGQSEEELSRDALRHALVELCRGGQWRPELWPCWENFTYYESLQHALDPKRQTVSVRPEEKLLERLEALGLEHSEELELIDEDDLLPPDTPEELKKQYPALYGYGGVTYDVDYRPERRTVTLRWRSGPRDSRPKADQLPRWNGWKVEVDERGRVTPLRP